MATHQLLSFARRGDAVTHQALGLRQELSAGGPSRLIADVFDDSVAGDDVVALDEARAGISDDDLVLYHVTIGCEPAVAWLHDRKGPYGIVYHNITPHRFFEDLSWDHARFAERGRAELASLVPGAAVIIADSAYNAAEIEALGGTVNLIHPPLTTTRRLADHRDDPRITRRFRREPGSTFLHVGQRVPHKRSHQLVVALHLLVTHLRTPATLTLVGAAPVPAYDEVVTGLADELAPGRCHATGLVPDREVATRLRHATALVTTSQHEGFYVPAVEAMAVGTPVLACDAGAVAETTGGAALLLPVDAPPTLVAEAFHALATDPGLRSDLAARGRRRAAEIEAAIDLPRLARTVTDCR